MGSFEDYIHTLNGKKADLAELIYSRKPDFGEVFSILYFLKTDEECQLVIDFINDNPEIPFFRINGYAREVASERKRSEKTKSISVSPTYQPKESFFKRTFPSYPDLSIDKLDMSFTMHGATKNTPIIYSILEKIPDDYCRVNKKDVTLVIEGECEIAKYISLVSQLLSIVKRWKSTCLWINDTKINPATEFCHIYSFLFGKYGGEQMIRIAVPNHQKRLYSTRRASVNNQYIRQISLSKTDVSYSLTAVVDEYIHVYGVNKSVEQYEVSQYDRVVVLEDDLIVSFRVLPRPWRWEEQKVEDWKYPEIVIQELTHNNLYDFNWSEFKTHFSSNDFVFDFFKFRGVHYYNSLVDHYDYINSLLPELELDKRHNDYLGELYHFVILRMEDVDGKIVYGIGYTKNKVITFIKRFYKEFEKKASSSLRHGASCLPWHDNHAFIEAFLSWKGKSKKWRLDNKFSYYYEDINIKNERDLFKLPGAVLSAAYKGKYSGVEFGTYQKPANRWKCEEKVYEIVKKLYKDYQVLYQYRPYYLATEKGNLSYDVYICGLKIAVEYQGKQHFEPVSYFGGEEDYKKQVKRDELKAQRSKDNGIKIVYINYWDDITPVLIKQRIDEALSNEE